MKALYPGLMTCLGDIPTANNAFLDFLFQSGSVEKSIGASFTDIEFTMFNNTAYGGTNHTMCALKKNHGWHIVVAAYTLFDLSKTATEIDSEKPRYMDLVKDGVDMFYTDDICGMVEIVEQLKHHRRHFYSYSRHSGRRWSGAYVSRRSRHSHRSRRHQHDHRLRPPNSNDVEEDTKTIISNKAKWQCTATLFIFALLHYSEYKIVYIVKLYKLDLFALTITIVQGYGSFSITVGQRFGIT